MKRHWTVFKAELTLAQVHENGFSMVERIIVPRCIIVSSHTKSLLSAVINDDFLIDI